MPRAHSSTKRQLDLFNTSTPEPTFSSKHVRPEVESDFDLNRKLLAPHPSESDHSASLSMDDPTPREASVQLPWLLSEQDRRPVQPARVLAEHRIAAA